VGAGLSVSGKTVSVDTSSSGTKTIKIVGTTSDWKGEATISVTQSILVGEQPPPPPEPEPEPEVV